MITNKIDINKVEETLKLAIKGGYDVDLKINGEYYLIEEA